MISTTPRVEREEFERLSGWAIKPEGACKDDRCVPLAESMPETIDLAAFAQRLSMPLVQDEEAGLWALGPEAGGKALTGAQAPDLELPDWRGETFRLNSLRGQKALLVAWASW